MSTEDLRRTIPDTLEPDDLCGDCRDVALYPEVFCPATKEYMLSSITEMLPVPIDNSDWDENPE